MVLMVIALVVIIVIVRVDADVVQHHPEDLRAYVEQQLPRALNHVT